MKQRVREGRRNLFLYSCCCSPAQATVALYYNSRALFRFYIPMTVPTELMLIYHCIKLSLSSRIISLSGKVPILSMKLLIQLMSVFYELYYISCDIFFQFSLLISLDVSIRKTRARARIRLIDSYYVSYVYNKSTRCWFSRETGNYIENLRHRRRRPAAKLNAKILLKLVGGALIIVK